MVNVLVLMAKICPSLWSYELCTEWYIRCLMLISIGGHLVAITCAFK